MKKNSTLMVKPALLVAFVLALSARGAFAAAGNCGNADSGSLTTAAAFTCTCPTGTGKIAAIAAGTALPSAISGLTYGASAGTVSAATTVTITATSSATGPNAANLAVICSDILPGYAFTAAQASAAQTGFANFGLCIADTFCPGFAARFAAGAGTNAGSSVLSSDVAFGSYTPGALVAWSTASGPVGAITNGDDTPVPCPSNTGTATVTGKTMLSDCLVASTFYVATSYLASGPTAPVISQATAGNTYSVLTPHAASPAAAQVACRDSVNNVGTVGGFICPLGTIGTKGATVAASLLALTGEIVCGTGYGPVTAGTGCEALAGYYGPVVTTGTGTPSTTAAATACYPGITGAAAQTTLAAACTDLKAGYGFVASVTSSTSLTTLIAPCTASQYGCGGMAALFVPLPASVSNYATFGIFAAGSMVLTANSTLTAAVTTLTVASSTNNLVIGSCPSGIKVSGGNTWSSPSTITDCKDLAVGWAFNPSMSRTTNITALLTQCTSGKYGCPGQAGLFVSGTVTTSGGSLYSGGAARTGVDTAAGDIVLASATALTGSGAATQPANSGILIMGTCPAFATNTFTATSSPTWSLTSSAAAIGDCTDLVPGYGFTPGVTTAGTVSTFALMDPCTAGYYGSLCAGSPGLFKSGPPAAAVDTASYVTGIVQGGSTTNLNLAAGELVLATPTTFAGDGFTTAVSGALLVFPCPTGSTNAGGAAMTSISSCIVTAGYYIDPSALNTPAACPTNEYCPGGGAVGTAGGDTACPHGSVAPCTSTATCILNSAIADCNLSPNFYIVTGALNAPVACPAASVCVGGASIGIAGGAVACPTGLTGSTTTTPPTCVTPAAPPANSTTSFNTAPVTVTPAAVTVTPAAVTVTPAPITVTTAPVTVTPAPITVNIPAPVSAPVVSAASTGSSALVLVLAALLALAAF